MFLVFVYSESRSTSKPWQMNSIDFYKGILLHVILVRIIVPCQKLPMISFVYKAKSVQNDHIRISLKITVLGAGIGMYPLQHVFFFQSRTILQP